LAGPAPTRSSRAGPDEALPVRPGLPDGTGWKSIAQASSRDKALKIPGQAARIPPSVPPGIHRPARGRGTAVIWYDPDKQGVDKLNGVLLKLTFKFK